MGPKGWCLLAKQQARARSLVMEYIGMWLKLFSLTWLSDTVTHALFVQ